MKFLIIILLILISLSTKAQYIADTSITKKLLLLEFRFWEGTTDPIKLEALLNKADIYKALNLHEQALFELERAKKYCIDQNAFSVLNFEKMLHYFLSDKYNDASDISISVNELEQIHKTKEYTTMKLFSLNESEKWGKCKQELLNKCSIDDSTNKIKIEQLPTIYNYVSPAYCSRLSSFIPGLGEIKAGYPVKGVTSLLINSGLLLFTGYNFYYGFYLTGIISGGLPLLKFYGGGKRLSERLAEEHNEKEKKKLKNKYDKLIKELNF